MRHNSRFVNVLVLLLVVGLAVVGTGCAKKQVKDSDTTDTTGTGTGTGTTGSESQDPSRGKIPAGQLFQIDELETVYFDYDKSNIRADQQSAIANNVEVLNGEKYGSYQVVLEGHCDERGSNEYNMALGERRSDSVYKALIAGGVSAGRLTPVSKGEEEPKAMGTGEEAWSKNRRVEFWLVAK